MSEAFDQEKAKAYLDQVLRTVTNPFFVFISIRIVCFHSLMIIIKILIIQRILI